MIGETNRLAGMSMTHKEMTRHIRGRLRAAGIKARCMMLFACGQKYIKVIPPYQKQFSEAEQYQIRLIAQVNRLTRAQGQAIDLDRMTDPNGAEFEFHQA